jgi:hypothetical protein
MDGGNSRLGSAQVRWNDYVGTAAADDANVLLNTPSLYELAGLDRERWVVVGLDFSLGGSPDEALVLYASERTPDAPAPGAEHEVDVTAFVLGASVQRDQFLAQAFDRVSVRLLSSTVADAELHVAERVRPDQPGSN